MRVLCIQRFDSAELKTRLRSPSHTFTFSDQEGFFEAALYSQARVDTISFTKLEQQPEIAQSYDAVVVNMKCHPFASAEERDERLVTLFSAVAVTKALFIGAARADFMLPDSVLNQVDVVFKREPYRDRTKYNLSSNNQQKIVPSMLSCPFVSLPRPTWLGSIVSLIGSAVEICDWEECDYEVGFSGADASHHTIRRDVWRRVVDEKFITIGGLQPNPYKKEPIPEDLAGPRFKGKKYRDALCAVKINLALPGIGEYTFRHQELLYLGKFMLSHNSIDELELPMPLEEGKHYVSFADVDEMVEKIHYYLKHEDERRAIAMAGKQLFDEYYDPERHGKEITARLQQIQR